MVQSQRTQDSGVTVENNEITEGKIHCGETGGVAGEQTVSGGLDSGAEELLESSRQEDIL